MNSALEKLKNLTNKISSYEVARKENIKRLKILYNELKIDTKVEKFEDIFSFKAVNLLGVSLSKESLGEIKEGKYLQILAIAYDKKATVKSKNISLGYFGRAESVATQLKESIVEFVLRYRFEKSFINLEHYYTMIENIEKKDV